MVQADPKIKTSFLASVSCKVLIRFTVKISRFPSLGGKVFVHETGPLHCGGGDVLNDRKPPLLRSFHNKLD